MRSSANVSQRIRHHPIEPRPLPKALKTRTLQSQYVDPYFPSLHLAMKAIKASNRNAIFRICSPVLLGVLLALFLPRFVRADTALQTSGNWNVSGNWTNGLPDLNTAAYIDGNLAVNAPTGVSGTAGSLYIGNSGTGTLNINGGIVRNSAGLLGSNAGSNGTVTMTTRPACHRAKPLLL